jgi:transcriptional regulator with XRE-family HTH domain
MVVAMRHLRELRKAAGFTSQDALARRLRMPKTTIARWETGARMPRAKNLRKLAKVLGITVDELLNPPSKEKASA